MSVELSVIIPAYNEAARLPAYLGAVRRHLAHTYGAGYEVIVVDDGSRDGLPRAAGAWAEGWPQFTLLRHGRNRGKGAAVRTGMLVARGRLLLFADADGATPIEEERELAGAIARGADVAVGSRLAGGPGADRRWRRGLCGRLFAWAARAALGLPVRDTQCGFKLFRRRPGQRLFRLCREEGYLFDVEVLARAQQLGYRLAEVPVRWAEVAGSKVRLLRDGAGMLLGLGRVRRRLREVPPGPARGEAPGAKRRRAGQGVPELGCAARSGGVRRD